MDRLLEGTFGVIVITDRSEDIVDVTEFPTETFPITGVSERNAFERPDVNPMSDEKLVPSALIYWVNAEDVPFELNAMSITVSGNENV
jgi:hypothetical protein